MNLFYHSEISEEHKEIVFDKDESRHIGKVLRKAEGDLLHLTNGRGLIFEVSLTLVTPKRCTGQVLKYDLLEPLPYKLHMAVAPTKLNDRFEWFLEKATEIGITEITPILCDHSERKVIKAERFEKIILAAMKQSLRAHLPHLNPLMTFNDFLKSQEEAKGIKLIAHCEEGKKNKIRDLVSPTEEVILLIGPEGDFSASEINYAIEAGFQPISLGQYRLRTETAAIASCHAVSEINS